MIDMDTRMRLARGIAKNETRASVEVFSALKRRGHPESPPPIVSDGRGGIGEAMVEVYGKVPAYQGRGRPPARKRPDPAWQYLQVVKQRPLWASTGTKNPAYSDVMYVEQLIAPDTVNTMPEATLFAFLEHGRAEVALNGQVDGADQVIKALAAAGISMEAVTVKLLADGVKAFADSYDRLLANIADKKAGLLAGEHKHAGVSPSTGLRTDLGNYLPEVEAALSDLQRGEVMGRIWRRDHTVWNPDPTEITDRLGWLTVTDTMCDQVVALEAFTEEVRDAGYRQVVLLGMGGSSLGPEVLRQSFQTAEGYPELIVLDSTVPAWVQAVTDNIDPARTLFLVSSKSGSTIEPNTFYAHFRTLVDRAIGKERAGPKSFVAITDPGTSLEHLAQEQGFRRVFRNPTDIGGRYSVLSYFGLVPAALSGVDVRKLLDRGDCMREGCASCMAAHDNPGAWLGTIMGTLAQRGRNKLTLVTSSAISSFALWAEQLLAESTCRPAPCRHERGRLRHSRYHR